MKLPPLKELDSELTQLDYHASGRERLPPVDELFGSIPPIGYGLSHRLHLSPSMYYPPRSAPAALEQPYPAAYPGGYPALYPQGYISGQLTPVHAPPPVIEYNNQMQTTPKKKEIKRRTRTGCLTCRQRRIKCDERKPLCGNCEKSKKTCLGYEERPRKLGGVKVENKIVA